jgi:hypothetical protein
VKKFIFPLLLIIVFLISGCQGNKNVNNLFDAVKERTRPDYRSNHLTGPDRGRTIGNDINNQNPNFLNLRGTRNGNASGNSQSYGKDVEYAKKVIRMNGYTPKSVWINGDRMLVTANVKGKLSGRDTLDAEARLHSKLRAALPRYNIDVRVR